MVGESNIRPIGYNILNVDRSKISYLVYRMLFYEIFCTAYNSVISIYRTVAYTFFFTICEAVYFFYYPCFACLCDYLLCRFITLFFSFSVRQDFYSGYFSHLVFFLNFTDILVGDGIEINFVNNFYINKSFEP